MKDLKKDKENRVEFANGTTLTINESLEKYKAPEYKPEKLKKIREQFRKGYVIHQ